MHLPAVSLLCLLPMFYGHGDARCTYHAPQSSEASEQHPRIEFRTDTFDVSLMNGYTPEYLFWKDSTIPYEFDSGANITADQLDLIKQQMERIANNTCVRFIPRTDEETFLRFEIGEHVPNFTCEVEFLPAGCTVYLGEWCLQYAGVVEHELLHSIGLGHEHQRYDRDEYIEIVWENLKKGSETPFEKDRCEEHGTFGCPYNFDSIMHYSDNLDSKNGEITIRALDPKYQEVMGTRDMTNLGAHPNDYEMVNRMHGCKMEAPGHTCKPPPYEISPNCEGTSEWVTASP